MTAIVATGALRAASANRLDPLLTYSPRPLSRGQRSRREVFVYQSPRNHRVVTIADAACFAYALLLEFDSRVVAYVERPRQLQLTAKQRIDVSFWTMSADGQERFHLLAPHERDGRGAAVAIALTDGLEEIALRNGVQVLYISEAELMSSLQRVATAYELLPLVWDSERIVARAAIAEQIGHLLRHATSLGLGAISSASAHPRRQVVATAAWMIHQGLIRLVDHVPGAADTVLELAHD
ncbi:hypothetical protein [Stenotrophomonas maltophilia]|uniref:hypothetical protein n=1 Tax=Stenotrophomonas maltophilia TaxID=40324 RepID=UPI001F2FE224|nr:hypothetical protein [Stenotrophomonas maltophilia]MCF3550594.1 hypothetical protein [Stenotrophomonas maltophilia]MCF3558726.1 hypothetical protein [Stenotrophomonas maltophilia]MCF3564392.1 hypothetical protein [Stenotrophomonas maltophilia]